MPDTLCIPDSPSADGSLPWWLWPNLIALDAPTVGIVWQRFFGLVFRVSIPVAATVTLALVILAVYLTDRWLDADPRKPHESGDRHRFARFSDLQQARSGLRRRR